MALVIVGNEKGGCGKTTIAINIVAKALTAGVDVLLVDGDPGQQSAARWSRRRREMNPNVPQARCVTVTGRDIRGELADLASRYAMVVLDTAAEDSPELRAAATIAQTLVVPVQAESLDLWTLPTMEAVFARATSFNPGLQAVIAVNRVPYQTVDSTMADVRAFIGENVPALPSDRMVLLTGRTAYGKATSEGLGVHETTRRDPRAVAEIERLYREVTR